MTVAAVTLLSLGFNSSFVKSRLENRLSRLLGTKVSCEKVSLAGVDKVKLHDLSVGTCSVMDRVVVDIDMSELFQSRKLSAEAIEVE